MAAARDVKGIALAQIAAVERLRAEGETRVGLLFVVGEEREATVRSWPTPRRRDRRS